jgi:hypothetical protein
VFYISRNTEASTESTFGKNLMPVACFWEYVFFDHTFFKKVEVGGANIDAIDASGTVINKYREEYGCALVQPEFFEIFDFKNTGFID